ncbi:MAG: hypothetical protein R2932_56925 [Caldilineaceae bacterium]
MVGSLYFARRRTQITLLLLCTAVPFIIIGLVTQATVQYHNRVAWVEQQQIWQELFTLAPDFQDDTMVLLILPGYQDRVGFQSWRRTPLTASWELSSALRLLYNNFTLNGDVYFLDTDLLIEPKLTVEGIYSGDTESATAYRQTVALLFDPQEMTLQQLPALPAAWVSGATAPIPLCEACIVAEQASDNPLRRLVQE